MKKSLLFICLILFVALANAGPPPEKFVNFDLEVISIVYDVDNTFAACDKVQAFEVREVAYQSPYSISVEVINNLEVFSSAECLAYRTYFNNELHYPIKIPSRYYSVKESNNYFKERFCLEKQHSNYGYRFSAF